MKDIEKRIQINDNRVLIYRISEGYIKPTYTITEGFLDGDNVIKSYSLSQWDDYGLNGWTENDDISKLSFEFDMNHPLYFPLFHLLNYDEELLIDDDSISEVNKRYMLIHRKKNKMIIDFIDTLEDNDYKIEKFRVFVKNILPDGRSKIDSKYKDTKIRLFHFFNEVYGIFSKDYHQMSIEECLLKDASDKDYEEMKMVFKKKC